MSSNPPSFSWDERQFLWRSSPQREHRFRTLRAQTGNRDRDLFGRSSPWRTPNGVRKVEESSPPSNKQCIDNEGAPAGKEAVPLPCLFETSQCCPNSIAKKAETLFLNLEGLIKRRGIESIGFVTLTFAENLRCRKEAQRRWNSFATNWFNERTVEYIATIERQLRGALHYHIVVAFPFDIRGGFNFDAATRAAAAETSAERRRWESVYFPSANAALRLWWRDLRTAAKSYGFGRCETLPVLSNSAAICRYVGSYVSSDWRNKGDDKGLRTVRYSRVQRVASIRWMWARGNGERWRRGCEIISAICNTDAPDLVLGKEWQRRYRESITLFGAHWLHCAKKISRSLSDNADKLERFQFGQRLLDWCREEERSKCLLTQ